MSIEDLFRWIRNHLDTVAWIVFIVGGAVFPAIGGAIQAARRKREMEARRARGEIGELPPPRALGSPRPEEPPEAEDEEELEAEVPEEREPEPQVAEPEPIRRVEWVPPPPPPIVFAPEPQVARGRVLAEGEHGEEGPDEPSLTALRPFATGLERGDDVDQELAGIFGEERKAAFPVFQGLAGIAGSELVSTEAEEPAARPAAALALGRTGWREAIVLSEVLSPPVSIRPPK